MAITNRKSPTILQCAQCCYSVSKRVRCTATIRDIIFFFRINRMRIILYSSFYLVNEVALYGYHCYNVDCISKLHQCHFGLCPTPWFLSFPFLSFFKSTVTKLVLSYKTQHHTTLHHSSPSSSLPRHL